MMSTATKTNFVAVCCGIPYSTSKRVDLHNGFAYRALDSEGKWHDLDIAYRDEVRDLPRTLCPTCASRRAYEVENAPALD